ncbi:MAG TPA: hypothetical protein VEA80_10200 [Vitreimonas sp.]|uniref:hypothetical protein n=1 Tax=Vitreimonas sp. TaxID=3069702 RepID=UPI002D7017DD|nr:hypothetical protein [Vitreimonas sp.]HYD87836.1 hypothetical protein [Vitreimonas sp.]
MIGKSASIGLLGLLLIVATALAAHDYFQERSAQFSSDIESGLPCPGLALTYNCQIVSGGYLEFRIGATSQEVFDILCRGSSVPRFRYAGLDAVNVPENVRRKHRAIFYPRAQTSLHHARSLQEFCALSEIHPYAVRYVVRRDRLWPFGDLITLEIDAGRVRSIRISSGTIDT